MLKKNVKPEEPIVKLIDTFPKFTKEQKVIRKAMNHISVSLNSGNKYVSEVNLNYALGLLESLTTTDDA